MGGFKLLWHYIYCSKHAELHININKKFSTIIKSSLVGEVVVIGIAAVHTIHECMVIIG